MIERDEMELPERVVDDGADAPERDFEVGLRPRTLGEFVGQQALKENLNVVIEATKKREEPLEHVLLYGNPGLGKTTLANIIAGEMGRTCKVTSGPTLEKVGDLAAILTA